MYNNLSLDNMFFEKICIGCGNKFKTQHQFRYFCGIQCEKENWKQAFRRLRKQQKHLPELPDKTCEFCGNTFTPKTAWEQKNMKYCCKQCAKYAWRKNNIEHAKELSRARYARKKDDPKYKEMVRKWGKQSRVNIKLDQERYEHKLAMNRKNAKKRRKEAPEKFRESYNRYRTKNLKKERLRINKWKQKNRNHIRNYSRNYYRNHARKNKYDQVRHRREYVEMLKEKAFVDVLNLIKGEPHDRSITQQA